MGLLDYDFLELAARVQHGLDRLTANFLIGHRARVHRDLVDFHGREHLDLELEHEGHHLRLRQVSLPRAIGEGEPALEEFESLFDGRPSGETPAEELAAWLRSLPAGKAPPEPRPQPREFTNPLLAEARPAPQGPTPNPLLDEQPISRPAANPFAPDSDAEERRRRALEWLSGEDR